MVCSCCGRWRIELVQLDVRLAYRVTVSGRLATGGGQQYPRSPGEVAALLRRLGGPTLDKFVECE